MNQRLATGHNAVADRHPGKQPLAGTGRDQNPLRFDRFSTRRGLACDRCQRDRMRSRDRAFCFDIVNLVLPQQKTNALGERRGRRTAARDHPLEINADLPDADAMFLLRAANRFDRFRGVEQRLAWNTSPVKTDAAGQIALDNRDAHLELARANRSDVTAGARTNYREVVTWIRQASPRS